MELCMASHTVGGSACVLSTRWRTCAGISTQSPGARSRVRLPSSKRSRAAPASSTTNSSSGWSYQKPGGLAWPVETMRSMRSGPSTRRSTCSSAWRGGSPVRRLPRRTYSCSMILHRKPRTRGIITSMVGKAIAQAIIHDDIQVQNRPGAVPIARQVATPETRKVMKNEVPKGRANRMQEAGSFFTVGRTICYGHGMSTALPFQTAKQLAAAIAKKKIGCVELLDLYLKRVEAHNPALNAIIAMDVE